MSRKNGCRAAILALAGRPEGVGLDDIPGYKRDTIGMSLSRLRTEGLAIVIGMRHDRRAFLSPEHAHAYEIALVKLRAERKAKWRKTTEENAKRKRAEAPPKVKRPAPTIARSAPVTIHEPKIKWDQRPVDYSKARVTVCPSPPQFGLAAKYGITR